MDDFQWLQNCNIASEAPLIWNIGTTEEEYLSFCKGNKNDGKCFKELDSFKFLYLQPTAT